MIAGRLAAAILKAEGPPMRLSLISAAAALALLTACTTAGNAPAPAPSAPAPAGLSSYGMFLAGEAALNDGKSAEAAQYFDRARQQNSGDGLLSERAFMAALLAGDVGKAAVLAPTGDDASESARRLGKVVQAVEALANGKYQEARTILASDAIAFPHKPAARRPGPRGGGRRRRPRRFPGPAAGARRPGGGLFRPDRTGLSL
jgi:hypothetical protein